MYTAINHLGTIELETDRLILRRLKMDDADNVFNNWTSDAKVTKYLRWNTHNDIEATKGWIKDLEVSFNKPDFYDWGIVLKETSQPIGSIGSFIHTADSDRYELGYVIGRKYWGNGYATEALRRVIEYLSGEVGLQKFIAVHAIDNPASGKVMEHNGFIYSGEGVYTSFDGTRTYKCKEYHLDINA